MNFKTKGYIQEISEIETLDNGAKKLSYTINQETEYNPELTLEIYKGAEYADHVDKFKEFNKEGDRVEVEFIIRQREYQGNTYTNISSWKVTKLTEEENAIQGESLTAAQMGDDTEDSDLPF